jgi:2-haloacid dehalogenase
VFALFDDIVVSGVERLAKPDPALFELAARRFGHAPETMLFVDDNADNIASAAACGWQVHLFAHAPGLERELSARGLI